MARAHTTLQFRALIPQYTTAPLWRVVTVPGADGARSLSIESQGSDRARAERWEAEYTWGSHPSATANASVYHNLILAILAKVEEDVLELRVSTGERYRVTRETTRIYHVEVLAEDSLGRAQWDPVETIEQGDKRTTKITRGMLDAIFQAIP